MKLESLGRREGCKRRGRGDNEGDSELGDCTGTVEYEKN